MSFTPEQRLILMTAQLRSRAPQEFDDFKDALKDFAREAAGDLVSASKADLELAQGRAQSLRDLCKTLDDAWVRAQKIEENARGRQHR